MSEPFTASVRASTLVRSFLVQGSWNYRTMIGTGFAFAMLPGLRRLHGGDEAAVSEALERHTEHFNAHPYLATVALGAVLRMEQERAEPDDVRRFKAAVRGPLGSLGDRLVWATWLPAVAVASLTLYWFGVPPWIVAAFFLVVYNVGHLTLRVWGLNVGLAGGRDVARRLGAAHLGRLASRLEPVVSLVLGLLAGAVVSVSSADAGAGPVWIALMAGGFLVGLFGGHRTWRPAAAVTVSAIVGIALWGVLA